MLRALGKRSLVLGVVASVVLHLVASVLLHTSVPRLPALPLPEPMELVEFDIHEAPAPPQAALAPEDEPDDQAEEPPPEPSAAPEEPEPTMAEILPEGVPAREELAAADAGPPDAAAPDPGPPDAGVADAMLVAEEPAAEIDAGPDDTRAALAAAGDAGAADAGALARVDQDASAGDASPEAVATMETPGDSPPEAEPAGEDIDDPSESPAPSPGSRVAARTAGIDLLGHLPPGDRVAVVLRLDRLRNTPWAARAEAILAPMPDYRTLIGRRKMAISDLFDTLVISTPRPRDVTATSLAGRTALPGPQVRGFLDHADARVAWSAARGGPAGRRLPSRLVYPGDDRVFLIPFPGWIVLAHPRHLGPLLETSPDDMDQAQAAPEDLPPWLDRLRTIETTAGGDQGPVLAATVDGLLPPIQDLPFVGVLTMPRRVTATVDLAQGGFLVRGVMYFDSPGTAGAFVATVLAAQVKLGGSRLGKMLLDSVHAYHALRGLSFEHDGARVAYATSISVADARGMLDAAAGWSRDFFGPEDGAPPAGEDPARP